MRARDVPGLDPNGTLAVSLRRIAEVRLEELESFVPRALDPDRSEAQHDMRIAAKRLRYVLELAAPALGVPARKGAKAARRLQEGLGDVRDCDELLARIRAHGGMEPLLAHLAAHRAVTFESFVRGWPEERRTLSAAVRALAAPSGGGAA